MKQEQLEKLAEWMEVSYNIIGGRISYDEQADGWIDRTWEPHKNSNQLDMLKKKFYEEAEIENINIIICADDSFLIECSPVYGEKYNGEGLDENECWLDILLNYVEKK